MFMQDHTTNVTLSYQFSDMEQNKAVIASDLTTYWPFLPWVLQNNHKTFIINRKIYQTHELHE